MRPFAFECFRSVTAVAEIAELFLVVSVSAGPPSARASTRERVIGSPDERGAMRRSIGCRKRKSVVGPCRRRPESI
jgi:hypothetical protein